MRISNLHWKGEILKVHTSESAKSSLIKFQRSLRAIAHCTSDNRANISDSNECTYSEENDLSDVVYSMREKKKRKRKKEFCRVSDVWQTICQDQLLATEPARRRGASVSHTYIRVIAHRESLSHEFKYYVNPCTISRVCTRGPINGRRFYRIVTVQGNRQPAVATISSMRLNDTPKLWGWTNGLREIRRFLKKRQNPVIYITKTVNIRKNSRMYHNLN